MRQLLAKSLAGLFLFLSATVVQAAPIVVAPGSTVEGKTIAEWTADWWQWAFGQSTPSDAFTDATGEYADVGQSGPVWFIAGTTGGTATRTFDVPSDRYLLFPLVNVVVSEFDFIGTVTEAQLRAAAASVIDGVDSLLAAIDGVSITDPFSYREASPLFSLEAATDNPFGAPAGSLGNAVSDGFWIMLEPLGLGTHTIEFGGTISGAGFSVEVTDTITGVPAPATIVLLGLGLAGLSYQRGRRLGA